MNEKFERFIRSIYYRYSASRPLLDFLYKILFLKPKFSGWGMSTAHELPWNDEFDWKIFRQTSIDVKKHFQFNLISGIDHNNIDSLLWRHWIVSYCVRHAIKFSSTSNYNFVECGTGDGISAFFALREISDQLKTKSNFSMHLYDSWKPMRSKELLQSESSMVGSHSNLSIETTKRNLSEFENNVIYHQGYIPESLKKLPDSPNSIIYLHIDLNSAKPTLDVLEFFYTRLEKGSVILFDDYGWEKYKDTKKTIDEFLHNKSGMLLKLPTGQAIYFY